MVEFGEAPGTLWVRAPGPADLYLFGLVASGKGARNKPETRVSWSDCVPPNLPLGG